ncbi:MAG: PilX N-terminal domain-containing pilus assembly protein [Nevskia sp.]|nr:PilX N-terminal domain-containing pilus assembly protein [Nevskia sp.]
MTGSFSRTGLRAQGGYALVTAILFLVLLTLVALTTVKNSGLEAKMGTNSALHTEAFESSEAGRHTIDTLIDAHVYTRGWPKTAAGGTVDDSQFDNYTKALIAGAAACPTTSTSPGYTLCEDSGSNTPRNWYNGNSECNYGATTPCNKFPGNLDQDASYVSSFTPGGSSSTLNLTATVSVYRVFITLAAGEGAQMAAGYQGLGRAAAAGGSNLYFLINGHGKDYSNYQEAADTSALYREVIKN